MRKINQLTAAKVNSTSKPGLYADGLNLYLQVGPTGGKSWLLRYMLDGKAKNMGLGPLHTVPLALAREKAAEARRKLLDGQDPKDARDAARLARKAEAAKLITFKQAAEQFIAAQRAGWQNVKHAAQWTSTLKAYAYPHFGDLAVGAVDTGLVLKALQAIWTDKPETATRVRGRIESVLDWATVRGHRQGDNPARWRGHLDKLLPARAKVAKVKHHAALPYAEISGFMADLHKQEGVSALALEFAILTAARTGEVIGATRDEIDATNKVWVIPAERMKAGREHRVPLSKRALDIIAAAPREDDNPYLFIGGSKGKPLSNMAMLKLLERMKRTDLTVHGLRSSFRDWAAETTAYPNEMAELALAHVVGSKVEAAYRRGDMMERRRRMMQDWADFCAQPKREGNVVAIREIA